MKILYVSPEIAPYAKTGGLADVAQALPKALRAMGHDVRSIMPKFPSVKRFEDRLVTVGPLSVPTHAGETGCLILASENGGVPTWFVENEAYFNREGNYGIGSWDYPDNLERFVFFCKAALECCLAEGFIPDIIHCNDWQTAPIPALLKLQYGKREDNPFARTRTVFSIHNIAYQGLFAQKEWPILTLPWEYFGNDFEYYGRINLMKGAIIHGDLIHAVSETYAHEIRTTEFGFGLQGLLTQHAGKTHGVLNGADYDDWNPAVDSHLYGIHYSPEDLSGKGRVRSRLREEYGLPDRDDIPLIGITSRFVAQKGIELIMAVAEGILDLGAQLIVLGDGEPRYHDFFEWLLKARPGQVGIYMGYNNDLAHRIMAAADMFLMPSLFEPCGLTQIYSMKYGTIPIVRLTGGLADTVRDGITGFTFYDYAPHFFYEAVRRAVDVFRHHQGHWRYMMETAMEQDFSWRRSAEKMVSLYEEIL